MLAFFTDLDGTLLDKSTYSAAAAAAALERLRRLDIPLVFCSSKTRAEMELWRRRLRNRHPFVVENGGALYVPSGYFPTPFESPAYRDGYHVFEPGTPYPELVRRLRLASESSGCEVLGFHDMSAEEIGRRYGLPAEQAALARIREYDEPFEILGSRADDLLRAIEAQGSLWTRGGRLCHITGSNNKADCVRVLASHYQRSSPRLFTAGLGDGENDLDFLAAVDIPVIVLSEAAPILRQALPNARVTGLPGPAGWNIAVLEILEEFAVEAHGLQREAEPRAPTDPVRGASR